MAGPEGGDRARGNAWVESLESGDQGQGKTALAHTMPFAPAGARPLGEAPASCRSCHQLGTSFQTRTLPSAPSRGSPATSSHQDFGTTPKVQRTPARVGSEPSAAGPGRGYLRSVMGRAPCCTSPISKAQYAKEPQQGAALVSFTSQV